jgi:plastocyanin
MPCVLIRSAAIWAIVMTAAASVARGEEAQPARAAHTGAVEGVVSYASDPQRPWRYARYYIKRTRSGELAEAVVALRGRNLASAGEPLAPATAVIDQRDFQFTPETIAIREGDSVEFKNSDAATHNVRTSGSLANINITMPAGDSFTAKFPAAGGIRRPVQIGCVFHDQMRAWVFVFDHPFYQLTGRDGAFRLENVPPGEYDLEMVHSAGELQWRRKIEIKPGATVRVDIRVSPDDKK